MNTQDLYWLAGILEGEGSFFKQTDTYPLGLSLEMTDEDVVQKVATLLGTSYCKPKTSQSHHKQSYKLNLRGTSAISILEQILPIMGNRRASKIRECLDSYKNLKLSKIKEEDLINIRDRRGKGERIEDIALDYPVSKWRLYQMLR